MKQEIKTEEDVALMVDKFYAIAAKDEQIGHFFDNLDWSHHLPRMINFWSFILIGKEGYKGNVLDKHMHMALTPADFERWLAIFIEVIDTNFEGENAATAKQRATIMAYTFKQKF